MSKLKNIPKVRFQHFVSGSCLMAKHGISTTPIVRKEFLGVRITPNVYKTLWKLDRFCEIVGKIVKNGCRKFRDEVTK